MISTFFCLSLSNSAEIRATTLTIISIRFLFYVTKMMCLSETNNLELSSQRCFFFFFVWKHYTKEYYLTVTLTWSEWQYLLIQFYLHITILHRGERIATTFISFAFAMMTRIWTYRATLKITIWTSCIILANFSWNHDGSNAQNC